MSTNRPNISIVTAGIRTFASPPSAIPTNSVVPKYSMNESTAGVIRHRPAGWIPPTSYSISSTYLSGCVGVKRFDHVSSPGLSYEYTGVVGSTDNAGPVNFGNCCNLAMTEAVAMGGLATLRDRALVEARSNLKGTSVNLAQAFGERNQAARLLGDTAYRLARSFRDLKHGKVRNAMRELGILPGKKEPRGSNATKKWLELQYGWKPLLSDIYGACDALSKRDAGDWIVTAKGSVKEVLEDKDQTSPSGSNSEGHYSTARSERGAFVRIDAEPTGSILGPLSSVGVTNPVNLAWELLPYSFVVDWILPIGSWLEQLDATVGYTIRGCSASTLASAEWRVTGISGSLTNGKVLNNYNGRKRRFELQRIVNATVPRPSFPGFKDPRSFSHMASGLSLLAQAFGRR